MTKLSHAVLLGAAALAPAAEGASAPRPGIVVFMGDSHTNGTGTDHEHAWPAVVMRALPRSGLTYLNVARGGATMAEQVALWDQSVAEPLASAGQPKLVFAMGGYNDAGRYAATAQTIVAQIRRLASLAHAAGARFVCGIDVLRFDSSGKLNMVIKETSDTLRADHAFCDAVVDFQSNPVFALMSGPYPMPPFTKQDQGVHLDTDGQATMAAMALPVIRKALE